MKLNKDARSKAKDLIKKHQYVKESDWSEAQPSTEKENSFLEKNGYADYGKWHLGIHEEESKETKGRYGFPFGDFSRVHRSGLIAAKQRAGQSGYTEIENAADELLELLEDEMGNG